MRLFLPLVPLPTCYVGDETLRPDLFRARADVVAAELFPTSCRNSAVGWGTACGRIGAMVAPPLMLAVASPLLLFMALSLAAACVVCFLPESVGTSLADVPSRPDDYSSDPGSPSAPATRPPDGDCR